MKFTIVMPTLNEAETLERPLAAALAAADEVVVSDGGSTDGTPVHGSWPPSAATMSCSMP